MSNKKRDYVIIINDFKTDQNNKELKYLYKKTAITFFYSKNVCKILFKKSGTETIDTFCDKNYFLNVIQRFTLLNFFLTGDILKINKIKIKINQEEKEINNYPIITLLENKIQSIPNVFSDKNFINLFFENYSKNDSRISSVFNYLIALSYNSPIEKFIHLWMAFNGIYGYISTVIRNKLNKQVRKEYKQLNIFMTIENLGPIYDFSKTNVLSECRKILATSNITTFTKEDFEKSDLNKQLIEKLNSVVGGNQFETYFGLLLTQNIYKTRCSLFHGTKKVNLFSSELRDENKLIKLYNSILEDYLVNKYLDFFSEGYFEKLIEENKDKIKEILK